MDKVKLIHLRKKEETQRRKTIQTINNRFIALFHFVELKTQRIRWVFYCPLYIGIKKGTHSDSPTTTKQRVAPLHVYLVNRYTHAIMMTAKMR